MVEEGSLTEVSHSYRKIERNKGEQPSQGHIGKGLKC